jgi:hypothetical protein
MYTAELPCGAGGMIVDNIFCGFQKSGIKCREVLLFIPLQRFYTVLFIPLFCTPEREMKEIVKSGLTP